MACGHLEHVDKNELRCDSPTADADFHCLIASYAASRRLKLMCADISSAYFQASPFGEGATNEATVRRPPRCPGGCDAAMQASHLRNHLMRGRGFYNRLCSEAKTEGLLIAPGLYYLIRSDGLPAIVLATHVDDLLWCAAPEGSETMERILAKFDVGKIEDTDFRFCGRRFRQAEDFCVRIDAEDNTRQIRKICHPGEPQNHGSRHRDGGDQPQECGWIPGMGRAICEAGSVLPCEQPAKGTCTTFVS